MECVGFLSPQRAHISLLLATLQSTPLAHHSGGLQADRYLSVIQLVPQVLHSNLTSIFLFSPPPAPHRLTMSQPPEKPAQEAQELAATPTVESEQGSTLVQQAQESLQAMETPSQNKEDESKLFLTLHSEI